MNTLILVDKSQKCDLTFQRSAIEKHFPFLLPCCALELSGFIFFNLCFRIET